MTIHVTTDLDGVDRGVVLREDGPLAPSHLRINAAGKEELIGCPGIGTETANRILRERSLRLFSDWDDLEQRVSGIGTAKVARLRQAGVTIGSGTP